MEMTHQDYMRLAIGEAKKARDKDEVPVGAVIVRDGAVIGRGHNLRETQRDPTAHAEMIALKAAAGAVCDWRLDGCRMYVTLEPCPMCAGAIALARIDAVFFGAFDERIGCAGSVYELCGDAQLGNGTSVIGGILEEECVALLKTFFIRKREPSL